MSTKVSGNVGPVTYTDGYADSPIRQGRNGELCTVLGHVAYAEAANRGNIMIACNGTAGIAPGTALTTAPSIAIWNPSNSGVNLYIHKTRVSYCSGTLGAGSIFYASLTGQSTAPTGGTEITPVCTKLGSQRGLGRAFTGSTLVGVPTVLGPAFSLGAFAGGANPPTQVFDDLEGVFVVTPGTVFVVQTVAVAGSNTPLLSTSVTWEEGSL